MARDRDFGEEVHHAGSVMEGDHTISVSVFKYRDGSKKVGISRTYVDRHSGDPQFAKLGRLAPETITALLPLLSGAAIVASS